MKIVEDTMDTNDVNKVGTTLTLANETVITMYVKNASGTHDHSRMTMEYSPDNVNWIADQHSTNGIGMMTAVISANYVRCKVLKAEGSAATAGVCIVAK